jgi:tetratricopeptide (TPR) repeat protein
MDSRPSSPAPPPAGATRPEGSRREPLLRRAAPHLLLAALVAAVYLRTAGNGFILLFDDDKYLAANEVVLRGLTAGGAAWAFTTFQLSNWHPLTWLSLMAEVSLFGPGNAAAHHLVSAALHGGNALLFFAFLRRTTGRVAPSLLAAALFAAHPIHVESVAWISERKDLLCALFFLLALHGWARYARRPSAGAYAATAALFSLALLSKPMAVTFPFVLLLVDAWPLGRTAPAPPADGSPSFPAAPSRLLLEKVPLLLLSAASCAVTLAAQEGAFVSVENLGVGERLSVSLVALASYLGKLLLPLRLSMYYPLPPPPGLPPWQGVAAALLLAALSALALREARRRPFLPAGWFWFLGTMVPVAGLVKVGGQAMADRYAYIPFLGLYAAAAFSLDGAERRFPGWRSPLRAAACAAVLALAALSFRQTGYWKDTETLFLHAIEAREGNYPIENQLGAWYRLQGREAEALPLFEAAAGTHPGYFPARLNAGEILLFRGDAARALPHLEAAAAAEPFDARSRLGAGEALEALGRREEAAARYRAALSLDPENGEAAAALARLAGRGAAAPAAPVR